MYMYIVYGYSVSACASVYIHAHGETGESFIILAIQAVI